MKVRRTVWSGPSKLGTIITAISQNKEKTKNEENNTKRMMDMFIKKNEGTCNLHCEPYISNTESLLLP